MGNGEDLYEKVTRYLNGDEDLDLNNHNRLVLAY